MENPFAGLPPWWLRCFLSVAVEVAVEEEEVLQEATMTMAMRKSGADSGGASGRGRTGRLSDSTGLRG
jgi:hypothetical protein